MWHECPPKCVQNPFDATEHCTPHSKKLLFHLGLFISRLDRLYELVHKNLMRHLDLVELKLEAVDLRFKVFDLPDEIPLLVAHAFRVMLNAVNADYVIAHLTNLMEFL